MSGNKLNVVQSYEDKIKTSYSDLKINSSNSWALLHLQGKNYNVYSDKEYISKFFTKKIISLKKKELTIVDLGGGDGVLLNVIGNQLKEYGIASNLINMDINSSNLKLSRTKFPHIKTINQDILKIKEHEIADVVLCRFVIQYLNKKNHKILIKTIDQILKKGGIVILSWPYGEEEQPYNKIVSNIKAIISNKKLCDVKTEVYNPPVLAILELLKKNKFKNIKRRFGGVFFHSPDSWCERFSLNNKKFMQLKEVYYTGFNKFKNLFKKQKDLLCLKVYVAFVYAVKK